jgi:glycosyltransferase involved in cell wall biosynthesis
MISGLSIVIPTVKARAMVEDSLGSCPVPCEVIVRRDSGIAFARNQGARAATLGLMVQLDDDLTLKPEIWSFIRSVKPGEFAMCYVTRHVATRVFIIHLDDFWQLGGFDEAIRYVWEDGEFYMRAVKAGLRFRLVPPNLYVHRDHTSVRMSSRLKAFKTGWEWCKFFARYNRWVEPNMFSFFLEPVRKRHYRDAVFKFVCTFYWLTVGRLT